MQLPVNVVSVMEEMTDVEAAIETPLSVSIYIDEEAPVELAAHVRNVFASSSEHVRMAVMYVGKTFNPHPTDDIAVLVAGEAGLAGEQAAAVRSVGVPVMVATLQPGRIGRVSQGAGCAIPDGDIVSPWGEDYEGPTAVDESGVFDEQAAVKLDERMGRWVVAVCRSKRLAFAIAFPFMRRPLAVDAVQLTSIENAGIGIIPFIPGADLPLMTLNQAKMVLQIAAAYGQHMDKSRLKELALVVVGAYLSRSLVRKLVAAVPVLGFVFRGGVAYGSTMAMGYAVIEYFEGGQNITGMANVMERAAGASAQATSSARDVVGKLSPTLQAKIDEVTPALQEKVSDLFPASVEPSPQIAASKTEPSVDGALA